MRSKHGDDTTWIQTFSGRVFYPLDPHVEDVFIEDVAHALALVCRYTGHCRVHYSVAEHSARVANVIAQTTDDRQVILTGLMHDAAEAYMADVARPIKKCIGQLAEIEHVLEDVISEKFDLIFPFPDIVKWADNVMLATERRDLMAPPPRPWKDYGVTADKTTIVPWTWQIAETQFLGMFRRYQV